MRELPATDTGVGTWKSLQMLSPHMGAKPWAPSQHSPLINRTPSKWSTLLELGWCALWRLAGKLAWPISNSKAPPLHSLMGSECVSDSPNSNGPSGFEASRP